MNKKLGVVAFAFGAPFHIPSNTHVGSIAANKARDLKALIYTQWDVNLPIYFCFECERIRDDKRGKPPSTLRIARGAVVWAKRLGLNELWIAAAKPHLWRCERDLKAAVCEAGMKIDIKCCEEIKTFPDYAWFWPESTQARTRSPEAWERRERILRILPFFIYKLICK